MEPPGSLRPAGHQSTLSRLGPAPCELHDLPVPGLFLDYDLGRASDRGRAHVVVPDSIGIALCSRLQVDRLAQHQPKPELAVNLPLEQVADARGLSHPGIYAVWLGVRTPVVVVGGDLATGWGRHAAKPGRVCSAACGHGVPRVSPPHSHKSAS